MSKRCLSDTVNKFNYNVQKVRFVAAMLVIISHAYPISRLEQDPLSSLTKGSLNLGGLAVYIFLFLSGLYAARTFQNGIRSDKRNNFFLSKIKRLCPSLLIAITLTVIVIGPVFTSLTLSEYLLDKNTWKYFLNCIFIIQHKLPGVFENNIYTESINGSLWSLPLEVLCFIALTILFQLRLISSKMSMKLAAFEIMGGQLLICLIAKQIEILKAYQHHLHLCLIFLFGALCYLLRERIYWNWYIQMLLLLLIPMFIYCNISHYIWIFLFLYLMLTFCFTGTGTSTVLSSLGKYSYEIYLIGFLTQQCVCYFFGGIMNPYINMAISIPIAVNIGIAISKIYTLTSSTWKNRKI